MLIDKKKLYAFFYAAIMCIISLYLLPYYQYGDQNFYREVYKYCFYENYTHSQQFFCYSNTIGSVEPIYFYLTKFAHYFIDNKDIYITILNTVLAYALALVILKFYKISWHRHLFLFLIFTNFYLVVLFFSAERLKVSILFLLIALLLNSYKRIAFTVLALLTHIQTFLVIFPLLAYKLLAAKTSKLKKVLFLGGSIAALSAVFILLQGHIMSKYQAYSGDDDTGFKSVIKTGVYIIFILLSTRKFLPVIFLLPVIVLSYFIGESRIGMMCFIIYASSVIYYKKQMDIILLVLMMYFSYKSIYFISNLINYGNGF